MSWISRLYQTYDVANQLEGNKPWPISHFVKTAHIEVVLDGVGNFKKTRTKILDGADALTLIPASESSVGRSGSKIAPHPLCEELSYCAKDLNKGDSAKFEAYIEQLNRWRNSEWGHPKLDAIYSYIAKGTLWADVSSEIAFPLKFRSVSGNATKVLPEKAFIRWRVEIDGDSCPGTWMDQGLIDSWISFDQTNSQGEELCLITGEISPFASNHPRFLRYSSDGAKLISSNDSSGYTFRGRFTDSTGLQNAAISSVATQKAHNALRWLINRDYQTFKNGDQVVVTWGLSNQDLPEPLMATPELARLSIEDWLAPVTDDDENEIEEAAERFTPDQGKNLGIRYAKQLNSYMRGYAVSAAPEADNAISILALDSATPGRMGITYYREVLPQEYIDTITQWHTDFAWPQLVSAEGKGVRWLVAAPSPKDILRAIYGGNLKSGDTLSKQFYMRLLPCIVEKRQLPKDFWERAFRLVCNRNIKRLPSQFSTPDKEIAEWEKDLAVVCALYKGFTLRQTKGEISMALDINNTSRDYLYGRLLAVGEEIERYSLYLSNDIRSTSASRLMQKFADRPYSTWSIIFKQLNPYIRRFESSSKKNERDFVYFKLKLVDEIQDKLQYSDKEKDTKRLSPEFLWGYHSQRLDFRQTKKTETPNDTQEGI